jgi:hypothetical protein
MAADRDTKLPFTVHARFREPPPSALELDALADRLELLDAAAEQIAARRVGSLRT